jgi:hypothetical protein
VQGCFRIGEAVWLSSSIADTAKSVKTGIPRTPVPVNSRRDGAARKSARASFTSRAHLAGNSIAGKPPNRTGVKPRPSLLPGRRLIDGTVKSSPRLFPGFYSRSWPHHHCRCNEGLPKEPRRGEDRASNLAEVQDIHQTTDSFCGLARLCDVGLIHI